MITATYSISDTICKFHTRLDKSWFNDTQLDVITRDPENFLIIHYLHLMQTTKSKLQAKSNLFWSLIASLKLKDITRKLTQLCFCLCAMKRTWVTLFSQVFIRNSWNAICEPCAQAFAIWVTEAPSLFFFLKKYIIISKKKITHTNTHTCSTCHW